jgi:hypothetical protein
VLVRILCKQCPFCEEQSFLEVDEQTAARIFEWIKDPRPFVQDAFPDLSAGDREMLLTGTHDDCWNRMFPDE